MLRYFVRTVLPAMLSRATTAGCKGAALRKSVLSSVTVCRNVAQHSRGQPLNSGCGSCSGSGTCGSKKEDVVQAASCSGPEAADSSHIRGLVQDLSQATSPLTRADFQYAFSLHPGGTTEGASNKVLDIAQLLADLPDDLVFIDETEPAAAP